MESKKCCRCRIIKDITNFYKNRTTNDGFQAECSQCKNGLYLSNKVKLFPKETCSCGKTIYKYYVGKHVKTRYHLKNIIKVQ
jgi:hypothetical protein